MWRRIFQSAKKSPSNRSNWECCDTIGPPDPRSLLRPIKFVSPPGETALEGKLRRLRKEVHDWNNAFWTDHNTTFHRERGEFITAKLKKDPGKISVGADEMSIFYKSFLDRNRRCHIDYNIEWYRKNVSILLLSLEVFIERTMNRFK